MSEPGEERSEQRDRLSGWGFLGMPSGVAHDDNRFTYKHDRSAARGFKAYRVMSKAAMVEFIYKYDRRSGMGF